MDLINNLRGKPWFFELFIILFFVVYLFQKLSETEKFLRWRIKGQPNNYDAHFNLGLFLVKNEDGYDEALTRFNKAISLDHQRIDAYQQLYLLQVRRKKTEEAEKILALLVDLFPNDTLVCVWNAMALAKLNESMAEEYFLKAISTAPYVSFTFEKYGYFLLEQKRYSEVENISAQAIKYGVSSNSIHRNFIQALLGQRKYTEAVVYARKSVKSLPNDVALLFDLGRSLGLSGEFDESITVFNKVILKSPEWVDAHHLLGISYGGISRHDKAVESFCKVIELDPNNYQAYEYLADSYCSLKMFVEADGAYRKAIELNQNDSVLYESLGKMLYGMSRYEDAEEVYREGISKTSENASLFSALGLLLEKLGRDLEAENCHREAIKRAPSLTICHTRLASLLCKTSQVAEATAVLEEFIRNNPENLEGYLSLASHKKHINQFLDLDALSRARSLIKKDDWYNLACLESINGNREFAIDYLRQAARTNHFDVHWVWEDPDLQWIRDDPGFVEIAGLKPEGQK